LNLDLIYRGNLSIVMWLSANASAEPPADASADPLPNASAKPSANASAEYGLRN
jgi:hypothetical protein